MEVKKVDKEQLHDIFLERLDTLRIQQEFSYNKKTYPPNTVFKDLKHAGQREYFHKVFGISKNTYENWRKKGNSTTIPDTDTIYNIAKHFCTNVDYLLGNTDMQENVTEAQIKEYTGLELEAIRQLHYWKEENEKHGQLYAQFLQSIKALNVILCDKYRQEQKGFNGWDVLHYIGSYLMSDKIVRETGYARYQSGHRYETLNKGDIIIKVDTKEEMLVDMPLVTYNISGNIKKIGVYEEDNPNNCYYVEIAELYKASALKSIGDTLDKIINRQNEKYEVQDNGK